MNNEQKIEIANKNLEVCSTCKYAKLNKDKQIMYDIRIVKQKFFVGTIKCIDKRCGCTGSVSLIDKCPRGLW